jgi:hypothetical protein
MHSLNLFVSRHFIKTGGGLCMVLAIALLPLPAPASQSGIHCEAIKRPDLETGGIDRGLAIYHAIETLNESTRKVELKRESQQKIWFGENTALRDHAGAWCKKSLADFECRHDGAKHTSYLRGGFTRTSQDWVLHSNRGHHESFQEDSLPFAGSGSERCHKRIVEILTADIKGQFLH